MGNDIMGSGIDGHMRNEILHLAGDGVDLTQPLDLIPEKLHPDGGITGVGGIDLHHIPTDPELVADKVHIVALILDLHQLFDQLIPVLLHPKPQGDDHVPVINRVAQGVDAGNAGNDNYIPPFRQSRGSGVAQLLDLIVDGAVLFNIGVGGGDIGFRLIVIVVGDEILHRIVGEKLPELTAQLGRQGLIMGQHQRRPVDLGDDVGHGKGLAGTGNALEHLLPLPCQHPFGQGFNGLRLVAGGAVGRNKLKLICHGFTSSHIWKFSIQKYCFSQRKQKHGFCGRIPKPFLLKKLHPKS